MQIEIKKYGYVQASAGAPNIVDCCLTLGNTKCNKVIFIGAVGALKDDMSVDKFQSLFYPNTDTKENLMNLARK